ncbi:hypothetical protein FOZ76_26420 [Verticiella sediminum]|uniref:Uncharacterized protein n=1 Tax=Verticiella sediminum TaxID=1247510 RepID=A0A556A6T2_9BURK|nr:hypothetical protein [Verticiella sediminum]TSH88588.1 hypothetical protein FOZ76_26420 [Verticiella sediminum]
MSRTYRRKNMRHEYRDVLRVYFREVDPSAFVPLDRHTKAGRRTLARFHADAYTSMSQRSSAPRAFRKGYKRRMGHHNQRMMCRWFTEPRFDPVFYVRHRHAANYDWW